MLRTLLFFIVFWIYQLYGLFLYFHLNWLEKNSSPEKAAQYLHSVTKTWAKTMVKITGSTVTVMGAEKIPANSAVLFVSNHQANFDIPILLGYLDKPKGFVAKVELAKLPLVSTWMEKIQCVFLDRDNVRNSLQAINQAIEILKNGHSMIIFPEGTRSKCEQMGEFKKGSLKLAIKAQAPIVPLTINGSYKIMGQKGMVIEPAQVKVVVGDPIYPTNLSKEEKENLAELVKERIAANLQKDA